MTEKELQTPEWSCECTRNEKYRRDEYIATIKVDKDNTLQYILYITDKTKAYGYYTDKLYQFFIDKMLKEYNKWTITRNS